jgi:hypothetical protein
MVRTPEKEQGSTDSEPGSASARYRDRAASLRLMAADTRFPEIRAQLMALALRYERIGAYVKQRAMRVIEPDHS